MVKPQVLKLIYGSPRAFVCEQLFSITRIDQEFLLAI